MAKFGKNKQEQGVSKDHIVDIDEEGNVVDPVTLEEPDSDAVNDNTEDADATINDGQAKLYGIPDYRTCDDETRALMDEHMSDVDTDDLQSIMNLGREEMQRLSAIAREVTERYGQSDNEVLKSLSDAEDSLGSIDISGLGGKLMAQGQKGVKGSVKWIAKNPGTAIATAGLTLVSPLALLLPGAKVAYDTAQKKLKGPDLADELRASVQKTDETVLQIVKALDEIPAAVNDLDALGRSRVESYHAVAVIIGAGREMLRRIDEDMIPEMEAYQQENPADFEAAERLERLNMGRDALAQHIVSMMGSRAVSQSTAASLMQLRRVFYSASMKLSNHLLHSVPQWEAQRAEAGIALFADKVAKTSDEADKRGTEMLKLSAKLNENTSKLMQESMRRGAYDEKQVIALIEAQSKGLKDTFKALGNNRADAEKTLLQLSKASEKFNTDIAKMQQQAHGRMLLPNMGVQDPSALAITDQSDDAETKGPAKKKPFAPKP